VEQKTNQANPPVENKLSGLANEGQLRVIQNGYELIYVHACGGKVWRHDLVDLKGIDYDEVLEIAIDKANIGCEVHVLPVLPEDHPLRHVIFKDAKARKCPDLRVDGKYVEIKTPIAKLHDQKISKNIKSAHAQADDVIIRLTSNFDVQVLARIAKGRFLTHEHLNLIEFKMLTDYFIFRRSDCI
jgi:hypothetical protein